MPATARFCSDCGAKMSGTATCVKCGTELAAGAKFCSHCGAPQTVEPGA
jgi:predicted amidophosphoribosyltransferase